MSGGAFSLQLDPSRPNHIAIFGRKGSGKSLLASIFYDRYPYDRMVIDPTGDIDAGDDAEDLPDPMPSRWLPRIDGKRSTVRYAADPGSSSYLEQLDAAVGLAFFHPGRKLLWIDEVGELTSANRTPPHMRRALHQGRHKSMSILACGPRPIDINPLVISQADYVACFELPNPKDRQRVADNIGLPPGEYDDAQADLVDHGFTWWDARAKELTILPPLPASLAARGAAISAGGR